MNSKCTLIRCIQPIETQAIASQKAYRGAFVNSTAAESPEATGEYWTWYMDIRRMNMAATVHKIEETMLVVTMNLHDFNMMAGNLVVGGIATAQLSKI